LTNVNTSLLSRVRAASLVFLLLTVHAGLLAWGAWRHSATWDEVGHLVAGLSHWKFGQFELYRVNPPLVRMVAVLPVQLAEPKMDWSEGFKDDPHSRDEFHYGTMLIEANGSRYFWLLTLARWACIPFSLIGGYVCYRWAGELYGQLAGFMALSLWCFSPNILAHGQLITPDVGATALGIAAAYMFWRWLRSPSWAQALATGAVFGLAQLSKASWVVLFPLWPTLWLVWQAGSFRSLAWSEWRRQGTQLCAILLIGLYIINLGYAFEGSFRPLRDYTFLSKPLAGYDEEKDGPYNGTPRNRFSDTWLSSLPVPVPKNYVNGIDLQKWDFERKMPSFLRGEWSTDGWWYYYLYGLAIKVPLGTWGLVFLTMIALAWGKGYTTCWRDELCLLAPLVIVLTLVSSQTGVNHHLRYVLPMFPFAFIWTSRLARAVALKYHTLAWCGSVALLWSISSSLWVYPHSLTYFNELVGGPNGGHFHLGCSNVDWGQDLLYLRRWLDEHPEAKPLGLAYDLPLVDPEILGIQSTRPPQEPQPGWYVIGVNLLHSSGHDFDYFLRFQRVDRIGYSMYVYHVTLSEANRVRRELGLAELPGTAQLQQETSDELTS